MSKLNSKIKVACKDCSVEWLKRSDTIKQWLGRCRSCAQKLESSKVHRKIISQRNGIIFTSKHGGIPSAVKFTSERVRGENNCNWKGGKRRYWTRSVKIRDGWKCKMSNDDCNGRLEAHHILRWATYPELRYEVNNGITLCQYHHPRKINDEMILAPVFERLIKNKA